MIHPHSTHRWMISIVTSTLLILSATFFCIGNHRNSRNAEAVLPQQNVEALTGGEITTELKCNTFSPIIICTAFCRNCNTMWTVPGISGQHLDGEDRCPCGSVL